MKKTTKKSAKSGLESMVGKRVLLLCLNYFYVGKLVAVDSETVLLHDVSIVYETGEWGAPIWKDAQPTNRPVHVHRACVEAWMPEKA